MMTGDNGDTQKIPVRRKIDEFSIQISRSDLTGFTEDHCNMRVAVTVNGEVYEETFLERSDDIKSLFRALAEHAINKLEAKMVQQTDSEAQ